MVLLLPSTWIFEWHAIIYYLYYKLLRFLSHNRESRSYYCLKEEVEEFSNRSICWSRRQGNRFFPVHPCNQSVVSRPVVLGPRPLYANSSAFLYGDNTEKPFTLRVLTKYMKYTCLIQSTSNLKVKRMARRNRSLVILIGFLFSTFLRRQNRKWNWQCPSQYLSSILNAKYLEVACI